MQGPQRARAVGDGLYLHLVQAARHLFAVARDEGDGVALVQQRDCTSNLRAVEMQFSGEGLGEFCDGKDVFGLGWSERCAGITIGQRSCLPSIDV